MKARIWFAVVATSVCVASAGASEYDEFRIPDHHWRSLSVGAEGRLTGLDRGFESSETSTGGGTGRIDMSAEWGRDSDARQHRLGVALFAQGVRGSGAFSRFTDYSGVGALTWYRTENVEQVERSLAEQLVLGASWREYPGEAPWGIQASLSARADFDQRWTNETRSMQDLIDGLDRRFHDVSDGEYWRYDYFATGSVQLGYGRVRDATGIEQARLLADRLRRDGRLAHEPSPRAVQRLAQLFYAEPAYRAPHDLPRRFFWRDIEAILREDGSLGPGGLDAFEALHALDPLVVAGGRFARPAGWFFGPVLTFTHRSGLFRYDRNSESRAFQADTLFSESAVRSASRAEFGDDVVLAGGAVEWHRPSGRRAQLDLRSTARFDLEGVGVLSSWESRATLGYLVDERWFAWFDAGHARFIGHQETWGDGWLVSVRCGVRYDLEDRWNLGLEYAYGQGEHAGPGMTHGDFLREQSVVLRLGWDRGALDLPGLAGPVRPIH